MYTNMEADRGRVEREHLVRWRRPRKTVPSKAVLLEENARRVKQDTLEGKCMPYLKGRNLEPAERH